MRRQRCPIWIILMAVVPMLGETLGEDGSGGEMTFYQDLAWSPDGSRIAYCAMKVSRSRWEKEKYGALEGTDYDLYVMKADGTEVRRLTENPGYDLWLSWSPDGRRLVFGSERGGGADLYVMDADGSHLTRLTRDSGKESGPAWSPDGRRIAFMSKPGEHWQLRVMNADGSESRPITTEAVNHSNPAWSPDGRTLAYFAGAGGATRDQVFLIEPDGAGPPRPIAEGVFPAWSPDGRLIIFGREGRLYTAAADGSDTRLLAEKAEFGRFSPDGRTVAFVMGDFPDTDIYVMNADGTDRRRLTP